MNPISYSAELSNLTLTPYKYIICSLAISFSSTESYLDKNLIPFKQQFFIYYETINDLITYGFKNETSLLNLVQMSHDLITSKAKNDSISEEGIKNLIENFKIKITNNINRIQNINDIYSFFKENISPLHPIDLVEQTKQKEEEKIVTFETGGVIDNFLRKCLSAFHKLSFNQLITLFESIIRYKNEEIIVPLTQKESDKLFNEFFISKNEAKVYNNFKNFSQKTLFDISQDKELNDKLFNFHKFYDHNLRYIYNDNPNSNETKIHYSLLYLTNLYYDCGYYDRAIQILFECVKLSQSNCDHEALLKCFLWLSKIYIQIGNFDLASQCLSTCLNKSFQNNFQLIYFLSSLELANLNFIFNVNVDITDDNEKNKERCLEEKILAHSNNYLHLFKNISDFYTTKDKEIKDDLNTMITYTHHHLIFNLIQKGEFSLAIEYLKISLKEISQILKGTLTETTKEIINSVITIMMNIVDYDFKFAVGIIYDFYFKYNSDLITNDDIIWIVIKKYCIESKLFKNYNSNNKKENLGVFYQIVDEFYGFVHLINRSYIVKNSIEKDLINFITKCKGFHILSYRNKGFVLLSKVYISQGRYTEAIGILEKVINGNNTSVYEKTISKIALCECYYKSKNCKAKTIEILNEISTVVDRVCNISDKYSYYFLVKEIDESNKEKITMKCLQYAIELNNELKIQKVLKSIKDKERAELLGKSIKELQEENLKYFKILNSFSLTPKEGIEVISEIIENNKSYIEKNIKI